MPFVQTLLLPGVSWTAPPVAMSIIPPSIIRVYAETLGISNLPEEVLTTLSQDLEYRMREVIQDASKYMLHSHRQKMSVEDVNAALRGRNMEPLYGFEPTEPLAFRAVPNTGLFYVSNEELDIETILQETIPKAPLPACLTSHWLAIEGVEPQIPQNPTQPDRNALGEPLPSATRDAGGQAVRRELLEDAEVVPQMKHVLSKELQLYYDTIVSDLLDGSVLRADGGSEYGAGALAAISALRNDAGLQQLLPYFVQFVAETVPKSMALGMRLRMGMDVIGSVLHNEHLFVEPYLHQLMPPLLTCVVGRRLGETGFDHWSLRLQAAELVALIAKTYGTTYTTLLPRVTKTLAKALVTSDATTNDGVVTHETRPLTTHFGAVVALTLLGPAVVDSVLVPILEPHMAAFSEMRRSATVTGPEDANKVLLAWRNALEQWGNHFGADADGTKLALIQAQLDDQ